jgi:hypothetical protein
LKSCTTRITPCGLRCVCSRHMGQGTEIFCST